jgi:Co/Zn/Cd efflux system component
LTTTVIGIVGSIIIARWAYVLLGDTGRVLLDRNVTGVNPTEIKRQLECDNGLVVNDLHIWTIAEHHNAVILSVTAGKDSSVAKIKENVRALIPNLSHITIEVEARGAAVLGDT